MFEHLTGIKVDDEPEEIPFSVEGIDVPAIETRALAYEPMKGASPAQVLRAKLNAGRQLEEIASSDDPDLSAIMARAALAPVFTGAGDEAAAGQLPLISDQGTIAHARALLTAFDYDFLQHAGQIRNLLVGKLIEDTENPRPQARLKAIELLGKVTEIGLFTEQVRHSGSEVSEEELDRRLTEKIAKFSGVTTLKPHPGGVEDVESVVQEVFSIVNAKKKEKKTIKRGPE